MDYRHSTSSTNLLGRIDEFLKFKKSQTSLNSTLKQLTHSLQRKTPLSPAVPPDPVDRTLDTLRQRNALKLAELQMYEKEYSKVVRHVHNVVAKLKDEQDIVNRQIELLKKQKTQKSELPNKSISTSLTETDQKQDVQAKMMAKEIKKLQQERAKFAQAHLQKKIELNAKIQSLKLTVQRKEEIVDTNQMWFSSLINNQQPVPSVDLSSLKKDVEELKKVKASLQKEQSTEIKKLKKEIDQARKVLRNAFEREEDKIKAMLKKLDAVADSKKDIKDIEIEGLEVLTGSSGSVEEEYKRELQQIGSTLDAQSRRDLGELLLPMSFRNQGLALRQSFERLNLGDLESELRRVEEQKKELEEDLKTREHEIHVYREAIQKSEKQIQLTRQSRK